MTDHRIQCRLTVRHSDFILQNHRVHGVSVIPGVTFADILMRILSARGLDVSRAVIRDVLFTEPVATAEGLDRELIVAIDGADITVTSGGSRHLTARLAFEGPLAEEVLDLNALKAATHTVRDMAELYAQARQEEIVHGAAMRCTGRLFVGSEGLLAELDLDPSTRSHQERFHLHPAALDASTLVAFARTPLLDAPFIPISVASVRAPLPLRGRFYVHVPRPEQIAASGDVMHNSYSIHDATGRRIAELSRLTCKRIRFPKLVTSLVDRAESPFIERLRGMVGRALNIDPGQVSTMLGFYDQGLDSVAMLQISRDLEAVVGAPLYPTLLFEFRNIETLAKHLAESYGRVAVSSATLGGFRRVWRGARAEPHGGPLPEREGAVVVRGLDPERAYEEFVSAATTILGERPTRPTQLLFVARDSSPQFAALGALARTISAETPILRCRSVIVDDSIDVEEEIARELATDDGEPDVRYRGGRREVPRLEPFSLKRGRTIPLKRNGVYLIAGGSGGLGKKLAASLVQRYDAHVVSISRSTSPPIDVTNLDDVRAAVTHAKRTHGRIDGVFHLAGAIHDSLFFRKDAARAKAVIDVKVRGAINLDLATRDERLDLFVLFSSLSAVVANAGQSDYAYASSFLDHFAAWRQQTRGGLTVSIGWPYFDDGGMRIDDDEIARERASTGLEPLPSATAFDALESILAAGEPHVIVTYGHDVRLSEARSSEPPAESAPSNEIAIIGVAGRYPQAPDLATFWRNLAEGRDAITGIPADRWDHDAFFDPARGKRGKTYSRWGGFIDGVDRFAPSFFSISRRDAERMDPQERLFLQTSWHALEDAGYPPEALTGERVGVFAGVMWNHYQLLDADGVAPTALHSSVANRVSYSFGFTGPSMAIDTACSSSLVALHMAVESIRGGDATMALAGGVNVTVHPQKYLQLADDQFLSDDGRCRAFGRGGTGYVPGEGVGVLVLKPLARAIADGDHIHAIIKGSAVNHSGRTSGYTVPDPNAQGELIREAIRRAGVAADSISYVEAHGTGTSIGDPIEIEGLRKAFGNVAPGRCAIGSVKSNIGHLESAAGVAGVTKVLLQLRHRELVRSRHAEELNEHIDFASSPFVVQRERAPWRSPDGAPLRAGVSAFGAGGTNAHVILESAPDDSPRTIDREPQIIVLSAPTRDLLTTLAQSFLDFLAIPESTVRSRIAATIGVEENDLDPDATLIDLGLDALDIAQLRVDDPNVRIRDLRDGAPVLPPLADVAFTLQAGRRALEARVAFAVDDFDPLRVALQRFIDDGESGSLPEIARRWMEGESVDWAALHRNASRRRVSLPVTPLPEERCWIGGWKQRASAVVETKGTDPVELQIFDSGIAVLTMRDEANRNMFTDEMLRELEASFAEIDTRPDVKVVVLTGTGRLFCMGGAPAALEALAAKNGVFTDAAFVYEGLLRCERPVIAAMQGHASGGGLAFGLYADAIVMSREGSYAANFLKYGFTPGMGASYILERRFGAALAAEMMLTGRTYRGDELERRGAQVSFEAPEQVLPRALSLAQSMAAMPADALKVLKTELARRTLEKLSQVIPSEVTMHDRILGDAAVQRVRLQLKKPVAVTPVTTASDVDREQVIHRIETTLCSLLYVDASELDHDRSFSDMGVDSIGAVEIVRDVNQVFGTDLDSVTVYDHPTVRQLTDRVLQARAEQHAVHAAVVNPPASAPLQPFRVSLTPIERKEQPRIEARETDIAIIGMSAQLPDAPDLDAAWRNLAANASSIREIPASRWNVDAVFDPDPNAEGKTYSRWAALLADVDRFDHRFFNLSPLEAQETDPQQRLFLTEAWKALENAGYAGGAGEGKRCGVFVGCAPGDYAHLLEEAGRLDSAHAFLGSSASILAARVAYFLDFHGPAVAVDTACSSSLVAVHLACQSLRSGESDLALASGVALMLTPSLQVRSSRVGMLSPTGTCAPFAANADGIVLGEGVGVVVLKRLGDAIRDGDHIHAVIKASGMNGDGKTNGITAPSATAQATLLRRVHAEAGIGPRDITCVEAHGTGTALGDPIEFKALAEVFGDGVDERNFCALGSIKGNIGHTTMTAGIAGLVKVVLALRHRQLPPTPGFTAPNPKIDFANSPFFFADRLREWRPGPTGQRIAAVSSFGFSGTNCHVVVAEPPPQAERIVSRRAELIPISARTEEELATHMRRIADALTSEHALIDVAYTLSVGRRHLSARAAVLASSIDELRAKILDRRAETDPDAIAYVEGRAIDWEARFRGHSPRRVPLPTYPFSDSRHWIARAPETDRMLDPAEPRIADHRVDGRCILAGAASVELVVEEAQRRGSHLPLRLSRIRWLRPLVIERPMKLDVVLSGNAYRIGEEAQPHGIGTVEAIAEEMPRIDLAAIRAKCDKRQDVAALYRSFDAAGLHYGPSFRLLREVHVGSDEAIATLTASGNATVPTAVLDAAFQTVAALLDLDDATPLVPVGVRTLDVYASLDSAAHAIVRSRTGQQYDIDLTDTAGAVLLRVIGLTLRPAERVDGKVFVPVWRPAPALRPVTSTRVAIIHGSSMKALADALNRSIGAAATFVLPYDDRRELDLAEYDTIYVLATTAPALLRIAKALHPRRHETLTMKVIADGRPESAVLAGLARTIAAEYPQWRVGCIDVGSQVDDAIARQIADEDCIERLVSLHDGGRFVRAFERAVLPSIAESRFRERGVYLILGGAGGIGFALSMHLAQHYKARLAWIGRTEENDDIHDRTAKVANAGGEVIYLRADAAAAPQLVRAVAETRRRFGTIHGAIHSAVVLRDRLLANMTAADLEEVLAAKVAGSVNFHAALTGERLDFLAFFSSAASLVDSAGQGNYAAASTFQDAYAIHLRREGVPATVINWGYWGSIGAVANDHHRRLLAADGVGSLEPSTAFAALERVLGMEQALIIEATPAGLAHFGIPVSLPSPLREEGQGEGSLPRNATSYVKRVFSEVLQFPESELDEQSTFEHFGVDSVISGAIVARLERDLGKLPATLLFEELSIERLAKRLVTDRGAELATTLGTAKQPASPEPNDAHEDVAVIGVAGRYPSAPDLDRFWRNLAAGMTSIREVPADRWDWRRSIDAKQGPHSWQQWAGFMDGVDLFDAGLFGILPRDAANIDPQERLFLETCWALLEQTGYLGLSHVPETGVFAGLMYGTYGEMAAQLWKDGELSGAHSAYWSVANRVSYTFDFHGPSFAVDSACSSSLTAVHLACESIRRGDCRMAIAGGVNLILHPAHLASLGARNMLAPDGIAKVFGAGANGYVPGEGVGAVLLKSLPAAIADGDDIWAVIKGGAMNAGGKTSGYTVPNPNAQATLVDAALRRARVKPHTISYVEAHGTGTELGDPIEIAALARAFREASGRCAIGSVKSNIGHLEGAAGIAGLTKVLLQIRHRQLVPTANLQSLNPKIELRGTPFAPQTSLTEWRSENGPRRAGVSSFGAGGANVHLIVEEWIGTASPRTSRRAEQLFVLSAPTRESLAAHAEAVAALLETSDVALEDLAYTSQVGRRAFDERLAIAATSPRELAEALRSQSHREPNDPELRALAAKWLSGGTVDWRSLWTPPARRIAFPLLPLNRKRYWMRETEFVATQANVRYERLTWERSPLRGSPKPVRNVSIAGDEAALADAVSARLRDRGIVVAEDADAIVYIGTSGIDAADAPFHTVLRLAAARNGNVRIICARIEREPQPHLAALAGLVKTLAQEHRSFSGVCVSFEPDAPATLAARIVDELCTGDDVEVTYRGGVRMIRTLQAFDPPAATHDYVAANGTYLITGGAGALGLHFANLLAERGAGKIVLVGRSEIDERIATRIAAIRGARYERADVTRAGEVDRLVANLRPLRGVIHAAGAIHDGRALAKTPEQLAAVLRPKVIGTLNLDRATISHPLDFFVLFSSVVGQTGNRGQADYAYANAFLDAFAETRQQWRTEGRRRGRSLSIAWPLWRDGGMTVDDATAALLERRFGMVPMSTSAGLDAFETLLTGHESMALVVEHIAAAATTVSAPAVVKGVGEKLSAIAAEFLLVAPSEIDTRAPLLDAGFDSISMTDLIARINETWGLELLPTVLFECPTLAELATFIERLAPHPPIAPSVVSNKARGTNDVAVIGMAGHLPGSANLDEFWRHLAAGDHLVRPVPNDREDLLADPRTRELVGGFLDGVAEFDAELFGIAPAEAALMDPQQRLFLQVVWNAFADTGYRPSDFEGTSTGVFAGVSTSDYNDLLTREGVPVAAHMATGLSHAVLANRVSHLFNLRGPSEAIDTACSSSLVAVHRAVRALRSGECDVAIAGGVSVALTPGLFIAFTESGMLSPDGLCKTFDRNANGYVRGEGAGVVLLKRLDRAIADGDHIHAVVKGTAVNHGGRAASLTAPNPRAQADVLRDAYADAEVDVATISYIEAHGTGTPLGDPVEIEGIKMVTGQAGAIAIGSVKTNIGHLEAAAGIAGLLKVLLAMRHGQLPPHLHLQELNPHIRLEGTTLSINDALRSWPASPVRRAGVSSFGFGGTNAHVVVEAAPPLVETHATANGPLVFPLSAPNPRRLAKYAHALAMRLESDVDLQSVAYVLQTGREERSARFAVVGSDRARIIAALREVEAGSCHGESDALAEAWVRGETVEWSSRWTQRPRRVSLPTFPLERTRHWFRVDAPVASSHATGELATTIRTQLAEILGIAASEIAADQPFSKLGLDSIFAMDLAERITTILSIEVQAAELYDHDTIDALTAFLDREKPNHSLRDILTTVLGRAFDPRRSFVDNGFTSLDMLRAVSELERSLGSLPKTLLFDQPGLAALTAHLCATYGAEAVRQLEVDDAPIATIAPADATIVAKRQIAPGSRLANVIHELAQKHGLESGLAGRDIAPLLFLDMHERGYLEFSRRRDTLLVWSYTGPREDFDNVVEAFVAYARSQNLRLNLLSPIRIEEVGGDAFTATPFGVVQQIEDLAEFSLDAPKMGRLRGMVNRFARSGDCRVSEYATGSDAAIDKQLVELVDRWAEGKPVVNPYAWTIREDLRQGRLAPEHRVFLTAVDDVICAVVIVTRMQSEAGYLLDAEFYGREMPMGGLEYTIVRIIDVFRAEGIRIFSFGATFGVKVCESPNASPAAERALDELRSVGVVSSGNYQFKNKFRPGELPIYLCQPVDRATDVADVLLMIGSPEPEPAEWNPLRLGHREMAFDLLTDSWAEREDPWIAERMRSLAEQQTNTSDAIEQPWLPFALAIPTPSGRAAEGLFCRAWPERRGVVLHNGLFPTWNFNLGDQRFTPMELVEEELETTLARERVSFIAIELSNNARGGHPTSLASLKKIRAVAGSQGVPLVLDATRILENAVFLADEEGRDPWSIVLELFALADAATFSLSKDWGVNFGGLVVSNLPELNDRLREEAALRGTDVGLSSRRLLQAALSDHNNVLRQVRERMNAVRALWQRLTDGGLPVLTPAGGHCVLLDVAGMPTFAGVSEFLSWIYERTGIRGGPHVAGNAMCRLAVPIGMPVETADRIGSSLAALFDRPEWFSQQLRELGTTLTGSDYVPANENLEVLREFVPAIDCRMVTIPEGEVEVFTVGAGPVLLLMQPFNIGAGMFAPQLAALSDRFRMIVIHQPGVGRTRATGSLSLDGVARLQQNALAALGVNHPVHVAGASVGAIFAQHFALTYPELTLSLSLIGGSYRFANRKGQIDKLEQVVREDFDTIVEGSGSVRIAEERERLTKLLLRCESMDPQTGLRYLDLFAKEPELTPRLGQIQAPTLILQGRHDSVVGVKTGHLLHGAIPNARYVELPASGHFVCFTDPDIVNRTMAAFLEEVTPAAVYSQL